MKNRLFKEKDSKVFSQVQKEKPIEKEQKIMHENPLDIPFNDDFG
jgi:hypothetical protein